MSMILFALPNLSSRRTTEIELNGVPEAPPLPQFSTKNQFRDWCGHPSTDHFFLSACQGLDPEVRVTADNPARRLHGVIADFDAPLRPTWQADLIEKTTPELRPRFVARTFSGFARAVWVFQRPVLVPNHDTATYFLKRFLKEAKARTILDGLDDAGSTDPTQYFELGMDWHELDANPVSSALVEKWMSDAGAEKLRSGMSPDLIAVPLETVAAEAARRGWQWPGGWDAFNEGARGTRFWDSGDAMSAIVRSTGMQCFTGERGFVPWASIFGPDFVRRAGDDAVGRATDGIYFEHPATFYVREDREGKRYFQPTSESHLRLRLRRLGLSDSRPKGGMTSPLDDAVDSILQTRQVQGTTAAFYDPQEVVLESTGDRKLNISNVSLYPPTPEANPAWGDGFPLGRRYFDSLFPEAEQREHFLAWVAHFYRAGLRGRPVRGLAAFVAGPPSSGKTFLSNFVLGKIFGSTAVATNYLVGEDQFNGSLFASPIWTVDDAIAPSDPRARQRYSQLVKMAVANDRMTQRKMYREGTTAEWLGRIIVTLNDDPESVQLLPSTEMSIMDKLSFFRASPAEFDGPWPSNADFAPEWGPFCAWLRDWKIPGDIAVGGRFGVRPYHHIDLVRSAETSQDTRNFEDMVNQWRAHFFEQNPTSDSWEGNPTSLLQSLSTIESLDIVVRGSFQKVSAIRHNLNKLVNRGVAWVRVNTDSGVFKIHRNDTGNDPF